MGAQQRILLDGCDDALGVGFWGEKSHLLVMGSGYQMQAREPGVAFWGPG